jgi:aminoglycoside phosphotransferase family enzyme/predicted kinase
MIPESSQKLIRSLSDSEIYPDPDIEPEVKETHMSWVILAGDYAYKIKKPIDLGFADFSSLDNRNRFCDEELRLNRRLAPDLYIRKIGICGDADRPVLGGTGPPIEFAVQMRRFPQESLLTRVLERGELRVSHIEGLAETVAGFHDRIGADKERHAFGTPESVWEPVEENLAYFTGKDERVERFRHWYEEEFRRLRGTFEARKQAGCVRECHGDMHLGNMILKDDSVVIFDGIEFNEKLRWIDVVNEIAFTVMDLEYRRRADLSHRFLNNYLENTGDYRGLEILPYYLAYRALVRAKVERIRSEQKGLSETSRNGIRRRSDNYIDLAERYTKARCPFLAITYGVSGSGKTTQTQHLIDRMGIIRIRSDIERKRLFGLDPKARTGSGTGEGIYGEDATERTYNRMAELCSASVQAGFGTIADATFLKRSHRNLFYGLAKKLGVPITILKFDVPKQTLLKRAASRTADPDAVSEAGPSEVSRQLKKRDPLTEDEKQFALSVESK